MFILKNLNNVCRKYEEDIWGLLRLENQKKPINLTRSFINKFNEKNTRSTTNSLRVDIPRNIVKRRRRSLYGETLDTRKKICYYYGGLSKAEYRGLNAIASEQKGNFSSNMLSLLELRLSTIVYRMNLSKTILGSIHMVLSGKILVNKEVINRPSFNVKKGDVVEVHPLYKGSVHKRILNSIATDRLLVLSPSYIVINYNIMAGIVVNNPSFSEVPYPFRFDKEFFNSEYKGKY